MRIGRKVVLLFYENDLVFTTINLYAKSTISEPVSYLYNT